MVRDNHDVTVLTQSAVPTLASFLRRQESRGAGQGEESLPPSWGKVRMGAVPRQRQPPRHHPHSTAVAARPSCVIPAKASIQTGGAPPPPTPAASPTPLPHRRGDSRIARPTRAGPPPRHHPHSTAVAARPSCVIPTKASIQTSRAPPPPTPFASPTPLPHRTGDSRIARPATEPTSPPSPAPARRRSPPSCVIPAKAGIQTGGATPPPTPAASPTPLPHRRRAPRIARPARAGPSPPSPAPDRRRSPPPSRHSCEGRNPEGLCPGGVTPPQPLPLPRLPPAPPLSSIRLPHLTSQAPPSALHHLLHEL